MKKRRNFTIVNHKEHKKLTLERPNDKKQNIGIPFQEKEKIKIKTQNIQIKQSKDNIDTRTSSKLQNILQNVSQNKRRTSFSQRFANPNPKNIHRQQTKRSSFSIHLLKQSTSLHLKQINNHQISQAASNLSENNHADRSIRQFTMYLISKMYLFRLSPSSYEISQEQFQNLVKSLVLLSLRGTNKQSSIFADSDENQHQIKKKLRLIVQQEKTKQLKLKTAAVIFQYSALNFNADKQTQKMKLCKLISEKEQLNIRINNLKQVEVQINKRVKILQTQLTNKKDIFFQLQKSNNLKTQKLCQLQSKVIKMQQQLLTIKEREQQIYSFVQKQETKILLKQISQEFKDIQAQIYDYAAYLQANQMATNPLYQPHPFQQMQKLLNLQLKAVNQSIMHSNELKVDHKIMRDMISKTTNFYHKKDLQMSKLIQFKTKCICQFVKKMKKWLKNWEFKQQFLANLRSQFAYDSKVLFQKFDQLTYKQLCFDCGKQIRQQIKVLGVGLTKIQENYKMGNFFY